MNECTTFLIWCVLWNKQNSKYICHLSMYCMAYPLKQHSIAEIAEGLLWKMTGTEYFIKINTFIYYQIFWIVEVRAGRATLQEDSVAQHLPSNKTLCEEERLFLLPVERRWSPTNVSKSKGRKRNCSGEGDADKWQIEGSWRDLTRLCPFWSGIPIFPSAHSTRCE